MVSAWKAGAGFDAGFTLRTGFGLRAGPGLGLALTLKLSPWGLALAWYLFLSLVLALT